MDYAQFHALEARVRQLEEVVARLQGIEPPKPKPVEPYVEKPHQPIDWTSRMSMPPQALEEMAKLGCGDPMADAAALSAGRDMVRRGSKVDPSQQKGAVGQGGLIDQRPLSHFGKSDADRRVDADLGRKR
jgi:hypothetical protein